VTVTALPYLDALEAADAPKPTGLPRATCALDAPPFRAPQWLVEDFWPLGLLGLLVGDGGTFKSSLALHIAGAIAGGYPVFDRHATRRRPVLVVSAEDELDVMAMRLQAFVTGHGWDTRRVLSNTHFIATPEPVLASVAWQRHLTEEAARIGAGFIVLDPWADMLGGDENANTDARPAIKFLRALTRGGETSVGVVHHMGKASPDKRPLDRIRGASALPSASRVIYFFDWREGAVQVENLKQSRSERLPTFVLERTIRSARDNRMHWDVARVTTRDAAEFRASESQRWVLSRVQETPGIGSRELRRSREDVGPSNVDIQLAVKALAAEGYLVQTPGKQRKMHLSLSPSGTQLVSTFGPVGPRGDAATSARNVAPTPDLFEPESVPDTLENESAQSVPDTVGTHSHVPKCECAECVLSVSGHTLTGGLGARFTPHPLKGVRDVKPQERPSTREDDDPRAAAEERAGLEEGL
jgi:AAA domain